MQLNNLFPVPVAFFDLGRTLTEEELDFLMNQETRANTGNVTSKDWLILRNEKARDLNLFIQSCVDQYFRSIYDPKHEVKLRITQSWMNYTKPGEYHHKHEHPNSLVSGVFYVNSDPLVDKIVFYDNKYRAIDFPPSTWNIYNSRSWWFTVGTGQLVLFPSSLTHMVETKQGENIRTSLAFNTFPVGQVGENFAMTGLDL